MADTARQPSFSRGCLDPTLHARTDLEGYRTGVATLRNMVVMRSGGVQNRAGFKFLAPTKFATTSASSVRIIPFIFNTDDGNAYAIEVGDLYMRFYKNGAQIRKTAVNISGITKANPGVITTGAAHGLVAGEEFYVSGVVGMKEVNGRWFKAGTVGGGGTTVELLDRDSANINTTSYTTYVSGGTTEEVYELTTTYDEDDVFELKTSQLNDTMVFTHPSYVPRKLVRTSDTSWAISDMTFNPVNLPPESTSGYGFATAGAAGANSYRYRVTSVDYTTGEESLHGKEAERTITNITQASPAVVTSNGHGYSNGDQVYIYAVSGMTQVNGNYYVVAGVTANTFQLFATNSTGYTAYAGGGRAARTYYRVDSAAAPTASAPIVLSFLIVSTAKIYNVYREMAGVYGYIGTAELLQMPSVLPDAFTFNDTGAVTPDTSDTPPIATTLFASTDNYPSCSAFYQQRLMFANTNTRPYGVWGSKTGFFYNFTTHKPLLSDDAIDFDIVGPRAMQVRSMLDLGKLAVFTSEGEYVINGDSDGSLSPFDIDPSQVSANGSANIQAMPVNTSALYVQARSGMVRDLIKTPIQVDGYDGDERSIWASFLFRGLTVTDSAYQQVPESIAWFVRSDGDMNAMTYIREQSIFGWHTHDTQGTFEGVCTVPESTEDSLYAVVSRTVNGSSQRYIERLSTRHIGSTSNSVKDNIFVDSAISFDGRNTGATTMTLTTSTVWTAGTTLTLTASGSYFNSDMAGDKINVTDSAGTVAHCLITAYTSGTVVSVTADIDIPVVMRSAARTTWARARKVIPQLWHLEGLSLSVQGDSFVEANPNHSTLTTRTVSGGAVTLGRWYEVLHIGLPYVPELESLDIDTGDAFQNLIGKRKLVKYVQAYVDRSRGVWAGEDLPADTSTSGLNEMIPLSSSQSYDSTPSLTTGIVDVPIESTWNDGGRIVIRQVDPLPLTLLAIAPMGEIIPRSR